MFCRGRWVVDAPTFEDDVEVAPEVTVSPVVLILGDFLNEGLRAKIDSLGFEVVGRPLRLTVKN